MGVIKKIGAVLGGLFALVCAFVLVCAFSPELTENLTEFVATFQQSQGENTTIPDQDLGQDTSWQTVPDAEPPQMEEGYTENGILTPGEGQTGYQPMGEELTIPQNVAGHTGYLPMEERQALMDQDLSISSLSYGELGEDLTFDTLFYPFYGMLSDSLQKVYRQVYANAQALNEQFAPVENLTQSQMKNVMEAVFNDHPELFWLDTAYACTYSAQGGCVAVQLQFNATASRLEDCQREFTAAVNEILTGAVNYTRDFEKERYIHDALIGRVEYNLAAPMNQSAYSALVGGETVCAGYARAFQYLMQQFGIPCYYCTGYAGEDHAWNIVRLDGQYYNVDVTWDDVNPVSYRYFNQTDQVFNTNHTRTGLSVYLPACLGTAYQAETENHTPNVWQNSSGNETDQSGQTFYPSVSSGDGESYDGSVLTSLQTYYDNCYSQLTKGSKGTIKFQNVVDSATLEAINKAYQDKDYYKGYAEKIEKEFEGTILRLQITIWALDEEEKEYLLTHTVVIQ